MNAVEMLKALQSKPVFGFKDVQRLGMCSRKYAIEVLGRMKARGLIKKISENAYTTKDDVNVVASNITYPSYISFWYASYYLGYTEQIVNTVQVSTTVRKKRIEFENYEIKFIPLKHFLFYLIKIAAFFRPQKSIYQKFFVFGYEDIPFTCPYLPVSTKLLHVY